HCRLYYFIASGHSCSRQKEYTDNHIKIFCFHTPPPVTQRYHICCAKYSGKCKQNVISSENSRHNRAFSFSAFYCEFSFMKPCDTLAQGQAQAGSAVLAASGFIHHIESLCHPVQIFLRDSMTIIRYPEEYFPVFTPRSDTDPAAF